MGQDKRGKFIGGLREATLCCLQGRLKDGVHSYTYGLDYGFKVLNDCVGTSGLYFVLYINKGRF